MSSIKEYSVFFKRDFCSVVITKTGESFIIVRSEICINSFLNQLLFLFFFLLFYDGSRKSILC